MLVQLVSLLLGTLCPMRPRCIKLCKILFGIMVLRVVSSVIMPKLRFLLRCKIFYVILLSLNIVPNHINKIRTPPNVVFKILRKRSICFSIVRGVLLTHGCCVPSTLLTSKTIWRRTLLKVISPLFRKHLALYRISPSSCNFIGGNEFYTSMIPRPFPLKLMKVSVALLALPTTLVMFLRTMF